MGQARTPPLRLLRAFCLAARHSSFKIAADRLALTPSAVSHQVKELEEHLGVSLFRRRSRSVELTATGRQFLEDLEPALEALNDAIARTQRSPNSRPQLHIVMPPFFAAEFFASHLQDFHDRHPSIDLHVDTRDPRPGQHSPHSDISILLSRREPEGEVQSARLFPLHLVAACSRELADSLGGEGPRALEKQTLIMLRFRPYAWERWLENFGMDLSKVRNIVEFDSMFAVARAAESGAGIALVPQQLCQSHFANGTLVPLPALEVATDDWYYITARTEDIERPEVLAFMRWMVEQFQSGDEGLSAVA